jgi:hypothetical protein
MVTANACAQEWFDACMHPSCSTANGLRTHPRLHIERFMNGCMYASESGCWNKPCGSRPAAISGKWVWYVQTTALLCKHVQLSFNFNVAPELFRLWKLNETEDYCVSSELWERHVLRNLLVKLLWPRFTQSWFRLVESYVAGYPVSNNVLLHTRLLSLQTSEMW